MICYRCKRLILNAPYSFSIKDEFGTLVSNTLYICDDCYHAVQRFLAGEDDDFEDDDWDW
jgi:epoxyqueuosine reductase QueG